MRGFYSRLAGGTLKERLSELEGRGISAKLSLEGELDVARATSERALTLFEAAQASDDVGTRATALAVLRDAITFVSEVATKAARNRALSNDTVDAEALDYVVTQVGVIIDEEVESPDERAAILARLNAIRLPSGAKDVAETTANDIRAALAQMDEMVPEASEDTAAQA